MCLLTMDEPERQKEWLAFRRIPVGFPGQQEGGGADGHTGKQVGKEVEEILLSKPMRKRRKKIA